MRKHIHFFFILVLLLTSCGKGAEGTQGNGKSSSNEAGKSQTNIAQTPFLTSFIQSFEKTYKKSSVDFGLTHLQNENQDIAGIDCMVYNQTAKTPLSQDIAVAAAHARSLYYRSILGCAPSAVQGMTDYETSRRHLNTLWQSTLGQQPPSVKLALQQSKIGQNIQDQIGLVVNEQLACRSQKTMDERTAKRKFTIIRQMSKCQAGTFGLGKSDFVCDDAWNSVQASIRAQGARDDLSYMSELAGRYHRVFLYCSPQDIPEYQAFHRQVPQHLFQAQAYRFRVPIDPIMACHVAEMAKRRAKRTTAIRPLDSFLDCVREFNMENLYNEARVPYYLTPDMLGPQPQGPWMYNPQRMKEEPERWTLNDCQKQMINFLAKNGFNIVEPEGLKNYCRNREMQIKREASSRTPARPG